MLDTILIYSEDRTASLLIARILRSKGFFALPASAGEQFPETNVKGIISVGTVPEGNGSWTNFSLPYLALGTACVSLCRLFGGAPGEEITPNAIVPVSFSRDPLFDGMLGGDFLLNSTYALELGSSLRPIAQTDGNVIGFRHEGLLLWGLQYPIERNDPDSSRILENFASGICNCAECWDEESIIRQSVEEIGRAVPERMALCAVSGGVDSTVCAKLTYQAIGNRLRCVYVDSGLGRQNEPEEAIRAFVEATGIPCEYIDAREAFLRALNGVRKPDDKERIATQLMEQYLLRRLSEDPDLAFIINGTNLNDNGGICQKQADNGILSPLAYLLKDEVRSIGRRLGLPEEIFNRQSFPSSGLALRITGEITDDKLDLLRRADTIFREEVLRSGQNRKLGQYYAILSDDGEEGHRFHIILRALQASGGNAARLPFDVLESTAQRIRDSLPHAVSVLYELNAFQDTE